VKPKLFKCSECGETSSAGEWNKETMTCCTNRDLRRSFVRIQDAGKRGKWYKCPKCHKPVVNSKLVPVLQSEILAGGEQL
jgi:DNA-directed RNA polymerase subunit RPC12/RpoP